MWRVGLMKVRVDGSGVGGRLVDVGTAGPLCGGEDFFFRGVRRGKRLSWSGLRETRGFALGETGVAPLAGSIVTDMTMYPRIEQLLDDRSGSPTRAFRSL